IRTFMRGSVRTAGGARAGTAGRNAAREDDGWAAGGSPISAEPRSEARVLRPLVRGSLGALVAAARRAVRLGGGLRGRLLRGGLGGALLAARDLRAGLGGRLLGRLLGSGLLRRLLGRLLRAARLRARRL